MNIWKTRLSAILACQLLLAIGLWGLNYQDSVQKPPQKLVSLDSEQVDHIQLTSGDKAVLLKKVDQTWTLPDYHGLPADEQKVEALLSQIVGLEGTNRVSQTDSAHERLELGGEKINTEVVVMKGESTAAHLLLGKSPSFGKRYIRLKNTDDVYQVEWDSISAQAVPNSWLDQELLAPGALNEISLNGLVLTRNGDVWTTEAEELDQVKTLELVSKIERLNVFAVSEGPGLPEFELRLVNEAGKEFTWTFSQGNGEFLVKSSEHEQLFQLGGSIYNELKSLTVAKLQAADQEEPETEEPEREDSE